MLNKLPIGGAGVELLPKTVVMFRFEAYSECIYVYRKGKRKLYLQKLIPLGGAKAELLTKIIFLYK